MEAQSFDPLAAADAEPELCCICTDPLGEGDDHGEGREAYEALMAAHEGLSEAQSHALNARLVLLLSSHCHRMGSRASHSCMESVSVGF